MGNRIRVLRVGDVEVCTGLSRSQIYRLVAEGRFPAQIKLSDRASGWIRDEVNRWLRERIRVSRRSAA